VSATPLSELKTARQASQKERMKNHQNKIKNQSINQIIIRHRTKI
jgi:hypothetical protein